MNDVTVMAHSIRFERHVVSNKSSIRCKIEIVLTKDIHVIF